jgi:hypothetical protein
VNLARRQLRGSLQTFKHYQSWIDLEQYLREVHQIACALADFQVDTSDRNKNGSGVSA